MASKELILSAGALDTPKLLQLSGVGPKEELSKHGIECVADLPGVGRNLQDHWFVPLTVQLKTPNERSALADPEALAAAREQFNKDGTGPLAIVYGAVSMAFLRPNADLEASKEYKSLDKEVQKHLTHPTVPTWELITHCPPLSPFADPAQSYQTFLVVGMIPQSRGT
ncbi:hypothetical protein LTS18_003935, partial [Coniosporium uncinatum]